MCQIKTKKKACIVSDEKSTANVLGVPLYVMGLLSLLVFEVVFCFPAFYCMFPGYDLCLLGMN